MGTGDPAHSVVAGVIVNLFKAGDTAAAGNYKGITLVSICHVYKHVAQAHGVPSAPARGQAAFRAKDPLVRAHAHPQEAVGGQQNCLWNSFWTCAKRMIQSGGMGYPPSC
jgi:hypothetical protein